MPLDTSLDHAFRRVARLSNDELRSQLVVLVQRDRRLTAELLVHLGEVDARRLHTGWAFSSLFRYCVEALGFSEDEAYKRITAARAVRKFPAALLMVCDGKLHLSGLLVVAPCLTRENHLELLGAACGKTRRQVEVLVAERFPKPDVPASVRKLPAASPEAAGTNPNKQHVAADASSAAAFPSATSGENSPSARSQDNSSLSTLNVLPAPRPAAAAQQTALTLVTPRMPSSPKASQEDEAPLVMPHAEPALPTDAAALPARAAALPPRATDRPRIAPLAPERYRITFTAGAELIRKLERAQELTSHAVRPNDIAALFERALDALIVRDEKRRFAARPGRGKSGRTGTNSARRHAASLQPISATSGELAPERVLDGPTGLVPATTEQREHGDGGPSRYVPADVRRRVFERDGGRCTFVDAKTGRRCSERRFIELDHVEPRAVGGAPSVENLRTVCRAHNALLARRFFGERYVAAAVGGARRTGGEGPRVGRSKGCADT